MQRLRPKSKNWGMEPLGIISDGGSLVLERAALIVLEGAECMFLEQGLGFISGRVPCGFKILWLLWFTLLFSRFTCFLVFPGSVPPWFPSSPRSIAFPHGF